MHIGIPVLQVIYQWKYQSIPRITHYKQAMIQELPLPLDSHAKVTESHNQSILILDGQEEQKQHDYLLEESRRQEILKQAYLCRTSLEITFAVIKTKFKGTLQKKEEELKKVIQNYFMQKLNLDIFKDFLAQRFEANYDNPETKPTGLALILYGIDFMDTKRVGNMFSTPNLDARSFIHKITWINDSNCRVTFFSPQNAQMILEHLVLDLNQYKIKAEEDGGLQLPKSWFELKPYDIYGGQRRLFARYATMSELERQKFDTPAGRYIIFENAKRGLELHLLSLFNAFEEYQKIINLIQFENYKKSVFRRLNPTSRRGQSRLSNDLLDHPLKNYFREKKFVDLQKEIVHPPMNNQNKDQNNAHNESIIAVPESMEHERNRSLDAQSSEGQNVNRNLLHQLEKNKDNVMVEEPNNNSYIMVDESQEEKPAPKPVVEPIQQKPVVNSDVAQLLPKNIAQPNQERETEKISNNQVISNQISFSISESPISHQEKQRNLQIESQSLSQPREVPQKVTTVQETIKEPQSKGVPPVQNVPAPKAATPAPRYPPKADPPPKSNPPPSNFNKNRILPASMKDHYEPDSY